ncbi:MAG: IS1595 family transposase [Elusimicrobia bacterium]|nr:IS1595 family transposase [Elusimicrobiota bacterium]
MRYTIKDFKKDFPDDKACLTHIFKNRYPKGLECPKCHKEDFYPVEHRRAYACSCGHHIYPTEGTIFHKSPTSLVSWFHAIFLISQSKNGVSAKEIERQLGVTYKCAWRIAKQIRSLMKQGNDPLSGTVEADETYIGGKAGYGRENKTAVFGAVERQGRIKVKAVKDVKTDTLLPEMKGMIKEGSTVITDGMLSYQKVPQLGFEHKTINHSKGVYVIGNIHTNSIDAFWGHFKRSVAGTYCSVSPKHLQKYLDEFAFRYDHRDDLTPLPVTMFSRVGMRA